jgi:hypothetical protein
VPLYPTAFTEPACLCLAACPQRKYRLRNPYDMGYGDLVGPAGRPPGGAAMEPL